MTTNTKHTERAELISKMVDRFLGWKLPENFAPDCGIKFTPLGQPNSWPTGTNLLMADQAREMFEYVLEEAAPPQTGCISNCDTCTHAHGSPAHAGFCRAFYDEPNGVCPKWAAAQAKVREAVYWQWRKKSEAWCLHHTYESPLFATTDDTEVRPLYTTPPAQPALLVEQQLAHAEVVLKLTETIMYMVGIAERGEGRKAPSDETPEKFVLDYVKRLEQELAVKAQPAREWQPIGTAPKDATSILLYCPHSNHNPVCEAWWSIAYEGDSGGHWQTPIGPNGRGYTILDTSPTHWMPLPDAPTKNAGQPVKEN